MSHNKIKEPQRRGNTVSVASAEHSPDKGVAFAPPALQFKAEETKAPILSTQQILSAKNYYTAKSEDYTTKIITNLQQRIGTAQSGIMDDGTVIAIAEWQKANGQSVDGKAGPRTLPDLFPQGLASTLSSVIYGIGYLNLDWSTLTTTAQRSGAMVKLVNKEIKRAGVPALTHALKSMPGDNGQFDFTTWTIDLDSVLLSKASLTEAELDDLSNTIYHEARHAEQWFAMAQYLAGESKTASEIKNEMGIPASIASAAFASPRKKGSMDALVAKGWYESIYGKKSAHRERVLGPKGTYEQYRNLPEEHDAWRVGDEYDQNLGDLRSLGFG